MREQSHSPLIITTGLDSTHIVRFRQQFIDPGRETLELVWRRTQEEATAPWSKPLSDSDARRRMVHVLDTYDVVESGDGCAMAVTGPHVWFQTASPRRETGEYSRQLDYALKRGGWIPDIYANKGLSGRYLLNGLSLSWEIKEKDERDIIAERHFPKEYNIFEVVMAGGIVKPPEQTGNIWTFLNSGVRVRDIRGNPQRVEKLKTIETFFPMQVELGCGPSIEAGIPPLHYLHELYYVSQPDRGGSFIFGPKKDKLIKDLVGDPLGFYRHAGTLYSRALTTEPTPFYYLLQRLHSEQIVVGDIITNNFDGLCSRIGLNEQYVRRFEENAIVPRVGFDPRARSLLVVGAHADRRKVQQQARQNGLQVIFVDPEGFREKHRYIHYPLESAQDGDLLINMTAQQFTDEWNKTFN